MRELTLNEKITIRGKLADRGAATLPDIKMRGILHKWYMVFPRPIIDYARDSVQAYKTCPAKYLKQFEESLKNLLT